MLTKNVLDTLSDDDVLAGIHRHVRAGQHALVRLLRLLAEAESRQLPQAQGHGSLFMMCRALGYSEGESNWRVRAARLGRRVPQVLSMLEASQLSLTTAVALAPVLRPDNAARLLGAAAGCSRAEVEILVTAEGGARPAQRDRIVANRAPAAAADASSSSSCAGDVRPSTAGPSAALRPDPPPVKAAAEGVRTDAGVDGSRLLSPISPLSAATPLTPRSSAASLPCSGSSAPPSPSIAAASTPVPAGATPPDSVAAGSSPQEAGVTASSMDQAVDATSHSPLPFARGDVASPNAAGTLSCATAAPPAEAEVGYRIHLDVDAETCALLRRAMALRPARRGTAAAGAVIKAALAAYVGREERRKFALLAPRSPGTTAPAARPGTAAKRAPEPSGTSVATPQAEARLNAPISGSGRGAPAGRADAARSAVQTSSATGDTAPVPATDAVDRAADLAAARAVDRDAHLAAAHDVNRAAARVVDRDAARAVDRAVDRDADRAAGARARGIPRGVRRDVYLRDGGRCAFVAGNGRRCSIMAGLEYDHVVAFARGGRHTVENLRLLCRAHNQLTAEQAFGAAHMARAVARRRSRAQGPAGACRRQPECGP